MRTEQKQSAFTLPELMISIFLVLILLLGIQQVFRTASETIGAGTALSGAIRDQRSAVSVLASDAARMVPLSEMPCLVLYSRQVQTTHDKDSTDPLDCRIDTLSYFARDYDTPFKRQTPDAGATPELMPDDPSNEAWVWYGHLRVPNNDKSIFYEPVQGDATVNPNNYYASQFVLGRVLMLLKATPTLPGYIVDSTTTLQPLMMGSPSSPNDGPNGSSRYDVAQTTIEQYKSKNLFTGTWWTGFTGSGANDFRFYCDPWPERAAYDTTSVISFARSIPIFLLGCSSFRVEYAGDFINQSGTGTPTDGIIDYIDLGTGGRQIRWYGFPRDVNGATAVGADGDIDVRYDVAPLRDVAGSAKPFERDMASMPTPIGNVYNKVALKTARYICAWSPAELSDPALRPSMLRITVELTDPANRLAEPQVFEQIITLP